MRAVAQWQPQHEPTSFLTRCLTPASLAEGYIFFDLFAPSKKGARDTARLVSSLIPASTEDTLHCLTFWYAAFGVGDTAELRVVKADNSSGELVLEKVWELQSAGMDTAHPVWLPAQLPLEAGQDFTLLLEGQAVNGGFAVDDITLSPGSCPSKTSPSRVGTGTRGCVSSADVDVPLLCSSSFLGAASQAGPGHWEINCLKSSGARAGAGSGPDTPTRPRLELRGKSL